MTGTSIHHSKGFLFTWLLLLFIVSLACSTSQFLPATETPLPTASKTSIPPSATPEPSSTPDLAATESAQATEAAAGKVAEIEKILKDHDIDLPPGYLAWQQEKGLSMPVFEYGEEVYDKIADEQVFDNFILYSKVTWTSSSGLAGCGIYFRAEGDLDYGGQYRLALMRFSGYPAWILQYGDDGRLKANITGIKRGKSIDLGQGATNEYLLIADGSTFSFYANGSQLGKASISQLSQGQISFFTWQESGQTECSFNDSWVWVIEKATE